MLRFARETRLSETTFVQAPGAAGADYRNRIFTMVRELAFAGHPSLGTAVAVAHARGERRASYVQQTPAGLQPVDVELDGRAARASMLQEPAVFGPELDAADVFGLVGLTEADAHPELVPQVVATGVPQVMVPVGDAAALDRAAATRREPLAALLGEHGAVTLFLAHWEAASAARPGAVLDARATVASPRTRRPARPPARSWPTCTHAQAPRRSRSTRGWRWAAPVAWSARSRAIACASAGRRSSSPRGACTSDLRRTSRFDRSALTPPARAPTPWGQRPRVLQLGNGRTRPHTVCPVG